MLNKYQSKTHTLAIYVQRPKIILLHKWMICVFLYESSSKFILFVSREKKIHRDIFDRCLFSSHKITFWVNFPLMLPMLCTSCTEFMDAYIITNTSSLLNMYMLFLEKQVTRILYYITHRSVFGYTHENTIGRITLYKWIANVPT